MPRPGFHSRFLTCGILASLLCMGEGPLPSLGVSAGRHFLERSDGTPFFWLGDTAWSLPKLTREEVREYVADRRTKQFTVIQVNCGFNEEWMRFGNRPYLHDDTDFPDEAYWAHMDFIVRTAAESGLYVALTVMWGDAYATAFQGDTAKARRLGAWLGARYGGDHNVIWIVAGEYDAINHYDPDLTKSQRQVYVALANGLRERDQGRQLVTIHPGLLRTSSIEFHDEPWLDFNMLQSGHVADAHAWPCWGAERPCPEVYELIERDYARSPAKPVLDGEAIYDTKPDGFYLGGSEERVGADVMRRKAYWSIFAGACGVTYGHNDVEVLYVPGEASSHGQIHHWREGLASEASGQLRFLRALIDSRAPFERVPDQSLIVSAPGSGIRHVRATRSPDGKWALLYLPVGGSVTVRLDGLSRPGTASWFDPRTGSIVPIGVVPNLGTRSFEAPGKSEAGNDWVLMLEALEPSGNVVPTGEVSSR